MIKELYLENWKSFSPSKVYIDPLTVLIGTNASGKSNLLDAFWFLSQLALGRQIESVVNEIRGGQEWMIRKGCSSATLNVVMSKGIRGIEYHYTIIIKLDKDKKVFIKRESLKEVNPKLQNVVTSLNGELIKSEPVTNNLFDCISGPQEPYVNAYSRRSSRGPEKKYPLSRVYSVLSQMGSQFVLDSIKKGVDFVQKELSNIFVLNPIPNNMRGYSPLSDIMKSDASNIAGVLSAMDDERRNQVEGTLTQYLAPLPEKDIKRVWTERIGPFSNDAVILCSEQWKEDEKPTTIDSRSMSDGTLRFLAIATAMMTRPRGSLLIVEEIDNGLHPSRTKELISVLKELGHERSIDVLCTTHNPVLVDNLGVEMLPIVFFVKRDITTGGSVVEPVEELDNLPKLLSQNTIGGLMTEGKL